MWLTYKKTFESTHKMPMAAIIARGNRVISFGVNKRKTHTSQKLTHPNRNTLQHLHAELDAIIGVEKDQLEGSTIYVCRRLRNGDVGISRPCAMCQKLIEAAGISLVYFSIYGSPKDLSNGWFDHMSVS
jgi:deoxycytidylate deaminase